MNKLNILIVGTGMYTCGRGTEGYGTIMPAICEWAKKNSMGKVCIVGTDSKSATLAGKKIAALMRDTGAEIDITCLPSGNTKDSGAYKKAIRSMPKPCACIVAVPDELHAEVAKEAITTGCHTLVVKPLAPTIKEVKDLIACQDRSGVYCAVEFHKRLDLANLMLKDVIESGRIGDPLYFVVEYNQRKSVPSERFIKWVAKTNVFQYLGIHYVDIIYFVTGAVAVRVMAIGQKGCLISKGIAAYDSIQAVIEWKLRSGKKFSSCIMTSWVDPETTSAMSDQKIKVIGTEGRFESDQKRRGIMIVKDEEGIEEPNPYFCHAYGENGHKSHKGYGIDSIAQFLQDVCDVKDGIIDISDLEKTRPTFRQSLVPTMVLEAVNASLKKNGMWVKVRGR